MFPASKTHVIELVVLTTGLLVSLVLVSLVHAHKKAEVTTELVHTIRTVHQTLRTLEEITNRNGADEEIALIAHDCTARNEFDSLLSNLNTLSQGDIKKVIQLFDACGEFFSIRKHAMVMKMEWQVTILRSYIDLYETYSNDTVYEPLIEIWNTILAREETRRDVLKEQVKLQRAIIDTFTAKNTKVSLDAYLKQAHDNTEAMQVLQIEMQQLIEAEKTIASRLGM